MNAVSYSVGMSIAGSLIQQNLQGISTEVMAEAIHDMFSGKEPKVAPEEAGQLIQNYLSEVTASKFTVNKEAGEKFLAENFKKAGVKTTVSGLQYEVITEGSGKTPGAGDQVTVHYHGTLIDGTVFDSSVERNSPATFGVGQVIKGWTEALQLMKEGDKFRLYIPQDLAYGASPHPGGPIEPFMTLIFDVELISVA
ncbi:MAG: FKBP-type peptidyl-prolyl cis-trans isomerase [Bacteroidetes bacterium]|nr:FKBP-type peptidyl-prolyl cis-trans isomerase [Bacteroidota bacterium]